MSEQKKLIMNKVDGMMAQHRAKELVMNERSKDKTRLTDREATKIARQHAYAGGKDHDYLPANAEEVSKFMPHRWVIDAIKDAYDKGRHKQ